MKISICTVTARKGFAQIQAAQIAETILKQKYPKDKLEWVLIDSEYEYRSKLLFDLSKELGLTIIHAPNVRNSIRFFRDITRNRNKALSLATGDAVIFLDDYACIDEAFVQHHVDILSKNQISAGNMYRLPAILNNDKVNDPEQTVKGCHGSTFLLRSTYARCIDQDFRRRKNEFYSVIGDTYTGNLGIPRIVFEQLNGFDPRMESALEDCDFGIRAHRGGYLSTFNPHAYTINMSTDGIEYTTQFDHAHDLELFICNGNNNFAGDAKLEETDLMKINFHTGYRTATCKICGASGMIDPNELIALKASTKEFQVPRNLPGGLDTF